MKTFHLPDLTMKTTVKILCRSLLVFSIALISGSWNCVAAESIPKPDYTVKIVPQAKEILERVEKVPVGNQSPKSLSTYKCLIAGCWNAAGDRQKSADRFKTLLEMSGDPQSTELTSRQISILMVMEEGGLDYEALNFTNSRKGETSQCLSALILASYENKQKNQKAAIAYLEKVAKIIPGITERDSLLLNFAIIAERCEDYDLIVSTWNTSPGSLLIEMIPAQAMSKRTVTKSNVEEFIRWAEKASKDDFKVPAVRPVLRFYIKNGDLKSAIAVVDRLYPPGKPVEKRAADEIAIFGQRGGRDMLLETLAITQVQYGHLAEARKTIEMVEEPRRLTLVMRKVSDVVSDTDDIVPTVFAGTLPGFGLSDVFVGGDLPDKDIPKPEFNKQEVLDFYLWLRDNPPTERDKDIWLCNLAIPLAKTGHLEEARELIDQAMEFLRQKWETPQPYGDLWSDVMRVLSTRLQIGDQDKVEETLEFWETLAKQRTDDPSTRAPNAKRGVSYSQCVRGLCGLGLTKEAGKYLAKNPEKDRERLLKEGYVALAQYQLQKGQNEDAKKTLLKYVALSDEKPVYVFPPGFEQAMLNTGLLNELEKELEKQQNKEGTWYLHIALQYAKNGETEKAFQILSKQMDTIEKIDPSQGSQNLMESEKLLSFLIQILRGQ